MLKLFLKYLAYFLVFWMYDLLIYGYTEEEHMEHIQLDFKKILRSWNQI